MIDRNLFHLVAAIGMASGNSPAPNPRQEDPKWVVEDLKARAEAKRQRRLARNRGRG